MILQISQCVGLAKSNGILKGPFYLACKMFLNGVENFHEGEVLFVQAAYNFLHAAKMHFMQL